MSVAYTITSGLQITGLALSGTSTGSGDGTINEVPTLPAAELGELTTRTSDTAGVITVATGGSYAVSDVVGLKFDDGYSYEGEVVDYTSGTGALQISSLVGDVLPVAESMIYVAKLTTESVINDKTIDGDAIEVMAVKSATTAGSSLLTNFYDSGVLIKSVELEYNKIWVAESGNGTLSDFVGKNIDEVQFYNFNTVSVSANWSGITNNIA